VLGLVSTRPASLSDWSSLASRSTRTGPGDRQDRDGVGNAPKIHNDSSCDVVPGRVRVEPGEGRTVVRRARRVGVDDLAQSVRAADAEAVERNLEHRRSVYEYEDECRRNEQRELHLAGRDFLAEILRRPANYQRAGEGGDEQGSSDGVAGPMASARTRGAGVTNDPPCSP
jgi:hypothetical protein